MKYIPKFGSIYLFPFLLRTLKLKIFLKIRLSDQNIWIESAVPRLSFEATEPTTELLDKTEAASALIVLLPGTGVADELLLLRITRHILNRSAQPITKVFWSSQSSEHMYSSSLKRSLWSLVMNVIILFSLRLNTFTPFKRKKIIFGCKKWTLSFGLSEIYFLVAPSY